MRPVAPFPAFTALLALASNVAAFNVHRHDSRHHGIAARGAGHRHKGCKIATVYETVTVQPDDGDSTPSSTASEDKTSEAVPEPTDIEVVVPDLPADDQQDAAPTQPAAAPSAPEPTPTQEAAEKPAEQDPPVDKPAPTPTPEPLPEQEQPQDLAVKPPPTGGRGKAGFAYNDANFVNSMVKRGIKTSWAYNWDSHDNGLDADIEFVPQLWSDLPVHTDRWTKNAEAMLGKGATHLLSFNEPDHPEQANMSPEAAARAHVKWMNPYAGRARIGGPAVTNSNLAGQSTQWLERFVKECDKVGCKMDFCVAHWYSPLDALDTLVKHVKEVSRVCGGKPVWLTEFAPIAGGDAEVSSFLSSALEAFGKDDMSFLERHSYFMLSPGKLMASENSLSSYGKTYFDA